MYQTRTMKKVILFVCLGFLINSCNSYLGKKLTKKSAEDIKVENLKDPCDCVDAFDVLADNYLDVLGNHDKASIKNMEDGAQKDRLLEKLEALDEIRRAFNAHCLQFGITQAEYSAGKDCSSYKDLDEKAKELEERM